MGAGWQRCAGAQLTQRTTRASLGTHRAQRARGPGRQVRPVPWRPEVGFHLGERSYRLRKPATCCPWDRDCEGQHAASGSNFGAQRPAVGHRGLGASQLRPSRPSGAHSPETLNLAGIHLREKLPPRPWGLGGGHHARWKVSLQGPPGTAPECAPDRLYAASHWPRWRCRTTGVQRNDTKRAEFPLQHEWGANTDV